MELAIPCNQWNKELAIPCNQHNIVTNHNTGLAILYINSLRPSVCLMGVLGGGGGRGW
jgi:hypothetical protein